MATRHFATLAYDSKTGNWYYISYTDGQFVKPVDEFGRRIQEALYGYTISGKANGFLGYMAYQKLYSNPDYLKWYLSRNLDRLFFAPVPCGLDEYGVPDTELLLGFLHFLGYVPMQLNKLHAEKVRTPVSAPMLPVYMEEMPLWLRFTLFPPLSRLRQMQVCA